MGAKTIEMETSILFKCNTVLNINMTAIFCISDNIVNKKSLYSGRGKEEHDYRHKVRNEIISDVAVEIQKQIDEMCNEDSKGGALK